MSSLSTPIGPDLARLRHAANLSQAELAAELGVSKRSIQKWEASTTPHPRHRRRLVEFFSRAGEVLANDGEAAA